MPFAPVTSSDALVTSGGHQPTLELMKFGPPTHVIVGPETGHTLCS